MFDQHARADATFEDYQDLVVSGPLLELSKLADQVKTHLTSGWARDKQKERDSALTFGDDDKFWIFEREGTSSHPAVGVAKTHDDAGARIVNIVPREKSELTIAEYNQALTASDCVVVEASLRFAKTLPSGVPIVLLSSNTKDYYTGSKLDEDLSKEFSDAGITFAATWLRARYALEGR